MEIPPDYQALRREDLELALSWRYHTREIIENLFKADYQIVDFIFNRSPNPRSFYFLERSHED